MTTNYVGILAELQALAARKSKDYGSRGDPYANMRASESFGVPAWVGVMLRTNDKMRRLQTAASGKDLTNESVEESLLDLANGGVIALDLFRQSVNGPRSDPATGNCDFDGIIAEIQAMHDRKALDYANVSDPYANVRASEQFGIAPWIGTLIRANDKMKRLQAAASGSGLTLDGVEDTLTDFTVYAIIALDLYRETMYEENNDAKVIRCRVWELMPIAPFDARSELDRRTRWADQR